MNETVFLKLLFSFGFHAESCAELRAWCEWWTLAFSAEGDSPLLQQPQDHSSSVPKGCPAGVTAPTLLLSLQLKIPKPREAQELPELCPNHSEAREHGRGSRSAPSGLARDRTLLTKSPGTPSCSLISDGSSTLQAWIFWRAAVCVSVGGFGLSLFLVWDVWGFFGFVWSGFAWGFLQSLYKLLWWQFTVPDWVGLCYF